MLSYIVCVAPLKNCSWNTLWLNVLAVPPQPWRSLVAFRMAGGQTYFPFLVLVNMVTAQGSRGRQCSWALSRHRAAMDSSAPLLTSWVLILQSDNIDLKEFFLSCLSDGVEVSMTENPPFWYSERSVPSLRNRTVHTLLSLKERRGAFYRQEWWAQ